MSENPFSTEQTLVIWEALQRWMRQDIQAQTLLSHFEDNPDSQIEALTEWLQSHLGQAPHLLVTHVSGGQVDKIVNIARAGVVVMQGTTLHPALHQLPGDIADFTGREEEMVALEAHLVAREQTTPRLAVVSGMGGVGKSTLAVHVAHCLAGNFPHAQLYVDLRGASKEPLQPLDALTGFLRSLHPDDNIPTDIQEAAARYRAYLQGQQALIVLDNASDEAQVRPLLPGSPSCAVLVTSRRRLSALAGAMFLGLHKMPASDSLELLSGLVGIERVMMEQASAQQIVDLCGRLPLALRIAGGTLGASPYSMLADYTSRLADKRRRLNTLRLGDLNVRASLELSYRDLVRESPEDARLFRLLTLLQGRWLVGDFGLGPAGALVGINTYDAEDSLERLVAIHLLEPAGRRRYRFHDLIRLFAKEQMEEGETAEAQQAALVRLGAWYVQVCGYEAERVLAARSRLVSIPRALDDDVYCKASEEHSRLMDEFNRKWVEPEAEDIKNALQATMLAGQAELKQRLLRIFEVFAT